MTMNQDLYRPFGDNFSARADDFKASESYRWVRLGIWLMLISYVLMVPFIAYLAHVLMQDRGWLPEVPPEALLMYVIVTFGSGALALVLLVTGALLLRLSPEGDEKAAANRYLWAYGIAIAAAVGGYVLGIHQLDIVRRIAAAYGSYYLLAYFPVLASNRDNSSLTWWADFTNRFLVILIIAAVGMGILAGMKLIPVMATVVILSTLLVVMFFAWIKTLWHALQATRPVAKDFEPDIPFE